MGFLALFLTAVGIGSRLPRLKLMNIYPINLKLSQIVQSWLIPTFLMLIESANKGHIKKAFSSFPLILDGEAIKNIIQERYIDSLFWARKDGR